MRQCKGRHPWRPLDADDAPRSSRRQPASDAAVPPPEATRRGPARHRASASTSSGMRPVPRTPDPAPSDQSRTLSALLSSTPRRGRVASSRGAHCRAGRVGVAWAVAARAGIPRRPWVGLEVGVSILHPARCRHFQDQPIASTANKFKMKPWAGDRPAKRTQAQMRAAESDKERTTSQAGSHATDPITGKRKALPKLINFGSMNRRRFGRRGLGRPQEPPHHRRRGGGE